MDNTQSLDNEIGNRIKGIRMSLGLNQQEFGDMLNLTKSAICTYEKGLRTPRQSTISLICKKFNVNPDYIKYGNEPIFISAMDSHEMLNILAAVYDLEPIDKDIIYNYLTLEKKSRKAISSYLKSISKGTE